MSLVTQAFIVERHGLRLTVDDLAKLLGVSRPALYNQICAGTCPVKTYRDGGKRYADYRDVAAHLDACHEAAT